MQVFKARYRSKFLQLTDIFLASSMVPAYTAASFAKRFARLALSVPPAGALCCIAFAHNLIRRHPGCMCLIHRPNGAPGADPHDPEASSLNASKGIESCLWELSLLKSHLNPTVRSWTAECAHALRLTCFTPVQSGASDSWPTEHSVGYS
jgi:U3 small nucleolar RNA-associated protein 19